MKSKSENSTLIFSNKVIVKPLSVNNAWQGKRFKTKEYALYEKEVLLMLKAKNLSTINKPIELRLKVGLSNKSSDVDNVVKPFVDIMQKKYGFNDKYIYRLVVEKFIVPKGAEYMEFEIHNIEI